MVSGLAVTIWIAVGAAFTNRKIIKITEDNLSSNSTIHVEDDSNTRW